MKRIIVTKEGERKLERGGQVLYERDFDQLAKSFLPGEWVLVLGQKEKALGIGFINLNVTENNPIYHQVLNLLRYYTEVYHDASDEEAFSLVENLMEKAIKYRENGVELEACSRLIYGHSDQLPGLIVDKYKNCLIIQINTAGLDKYRDQIKAFFVKRYPETNVFIYDHPKYREGESLPTYEAKKELNESIQVEENGLFLTVSQGIMQKIGYYFDHRKNRQKFEGIIRGQKRSFERGLDLYCYIGSWGLHLLRSGVEQVTFVDQGNFEKDVDLNLFNNEFEGKGHFVRQDVSKYLDHAIEQDQKFDVICVDPPAFAKKIGDKKNALSGYQKIFDKVFKILKPGGLIAACSCTYAVDFNDLDQVVQNAAFKRNKSIRLIDIGLQGPDHPMSSLKDKANYLKYMAYWVE